MLIGIDLLAVQSPEGRDRGSRRYCRQFVSALLAAGSSDRFVLYSHEGLPDDRTRPFAGARRVSIGPDVANSARPRPTIRPILDENPDGLDWLVLLDPFEPSTAGGFPATPGGGLRVASLVHDLSPGPVDDRVAALRRHDAIFAPSEAVAGRLRKAFRKSPGRVVTLGLACEPPTPARDDPEGLDRLGISGPFLLAGQAGGVGRADLEPVLDAYRRLPFEHRMTHQLVIVGEVDDPWGVIGSLHGKGCAEGLVLVGEVDERDLKILYRRCSAFLPLSVDECSTLFSIVEAMSCGSAVVSAGTLPRAEILGGAGWLVDPRDPATAAERLGLLLSDPGHLRTLRGRASARSGQFSWGPVVETFLGRLRQSGSPSPRRGLRVDRAHDERPRIAFFPDASRAGSGGLDLRSWPGDWRIDVYLEPGDSPPGGGFEEFQARQFDRNDRAWSYDAIFYQFRDLECLELKLERLRVRPGLVFLSGDVDLGDLEPRRGSNRREEGDVARLLREVFLSSSSVAVESCEDLDRIRAALPEFEDRVVEFGPGALATLSGQAEAIGRRMFSPPTFARG